ncbi:uncharacterized protein CANTADRAFT_23365 [Suhomyces tanzawaensis NRRL Y-17324]|uniref:SWR1-complex protein 4 n=1 Tax=Suhomyces tanzawaensis NRRL Y-17324 TaxID=984487 RepID=A0A1E4SCK1_9ASCO|nr:uncharacterized protein CANTADRAFT_23365 [Suhomyces tanzawaensis NRRL Y-17324]ODV77225.1 hypothetical protein CANTADRAFT_23365 [Suhomyces tanzawaensis NRRL Y-17324]
MSANDILDVLNIQRDELKQPPKKKLKPTADSNPRLGMARELYNLIGPNTPPVNLSSSAYNTNTKDRFKSKPSPWTRIEFKPRKDLKVNFNHWVKGSRELLESEEETKKPYFFEKFNVKLDIPELVDEETFDLFMKEIEEHEKEVQAILAQRREEKEQARKREREESAKLKETEKSSDNKLHQVKKEPAEVPKESQGDDKKSDEEDSSNEKSETKEHQDEKKEDQEKESEDEQKSELGQKWSYDETKYLFELCSAFELKWPIVYDRYNWHTTSRTLEDLKEQFYRICAKIFESQENSNPALIESLKVFSKSREIERKNYLENLLKRTPAEIAEEESLVIEARRFELAAKKMLLERSHLLTLLDSPQTTQPIQQYQSSQGLTNLYNNLMIIDKHQKKRQLQQQQHRSIGSLNQDPVPPPIPIAASSSFKKDRSFQTHLQQYLSGLLKQNQIVNPSVKQEANTIQQLLAKRLTQKEEEAYGLFFHGTEKLTPGVILRSSQKLPGLQQKQSVLKSVNSVLHELDIPTAGGTSWKPIMPTRKTMTKYDELIRSVVALLDVKKGKDKLEAEIRLIKSQRGLQ